MRRVDFAAHVSVCAFFDASFSVSLQMIFCFYVPPSVRGSLVWKNLSAVVKKSSTYRRMSCGQGGYGGPIVLFPQDIINERPNHYPTNISYTSGQWRAGKLFPLETMGVGKTWKIMTKVVSTILTSVSKNIISQLNDFNVGMFESRERNAKFWELWLFS